MRINPLVLFSIGNSVEISWLVALLVCLLSFESVSAVPARHKKNRHDVKEKHKKRKHHKNKDKKKKHRKNKKRKHQKIVEESTIVAPIAREAPSINNVEPVNQVAPEVGFFSRHKGKIAGAAALGLATLGYQNSDKLKGLWNKAVVPAPPPPTFMEKYGSTAVNTAGALGAVGAGIAAYHHREKLTPYWERVRNWWNSKNSQGQNNDNDSNGANANGVNDNANGVNANPNGVNANPNNVNANGANANPNNANV